MNKEQFRSLLSEKILILDGAMGTELQKRGFLDDIGSPEELNIKYPQRVAEIHRDYLEAGAEVVIANTFGANSRKLADYNLQSKIVEINQSGIKLAREVASKYNAFVAGDIGPVGSYIAPLGAISFTQAYDCFAEQVKALAAAKPDMLFIETMAEIKEVRAALLACKDNFDGPVIVQMTFTADGSTVTGTDVLSFLSIAESLSADAVGMNCSVGPKDLLELGRLLSSNTSLPVSFKPNAGMPKLVNRQTVFPGTAGEFADASKAAYESGINLLGGCCGTTPEFIKALSLELKGKKPAARKINKHFYISSRTRALDLNAQKPVIKIGERINPTNRKKFQEELLAGNFSTIRKEAQEQVKSGAHILDINLGLPGADETALMEKAVEEIQEVVAAPLCLDSSSAKALEAGLKACAGRPIINSVNGEQKKMDEIMPLAARYGAALIGLAIDDKGIPKNAAERLIIAERIIGEAKKYGIREEDIIIDYLTLAASAMAPQIKETIEAIRLSKKKWPKVKTVLGVSNVSFGLPVRQVLNSTFLKLCETAGLDMAILNPHEDWKISDELAKNLLEGNDPNGAAYIAKYSGAPKKAPAPAGREVSPQEKLYEAIVEGNREETPALVKQVLSLGMPPLAAANDIILKGLNSVGEKFAKKEYFLPQVILSAEAAQLAFGIIKPLLKSGGGFSSGKMVLATVKGDVHDIGKNIVAAVLESHGWEIIDLGKNVEAKEIVEKARTENAGLIGLSALMTTTMLEMEEVVKARNASGIKTKVIVGGAPVTEKFAKEIGADGYAKDAVEAAKLAKHIIK